MLPLRRYSTKLIEQIPFNMHSKPEEVLLKLGYDIEKFQIVTPKGASMLIIANYVTCTRDGHTLYLAGHVPYSEDGTLIQGKVGKEHSIEDGYKYARWLAASLLKTIKHQVGTADSFEGDLSKVAKILKLNGMVNSFAEFHDHPKVINGASDLLVEVFGKDVGSHSRTAIGCSSLPFNVPVEIDMIVKLRE
jgi:enamine deaminase RidA (YjgF/YER057c/UK114 family)